MRIKELKIEYDSYKCKYCGRRVFYEVKEGAINKYEANDCCSICYRKLEKE